MIFHLQFHVYSMKYYMVVFLVRLTELTHHTEATRADYVTVIKIILAIHHGVRGKVCHSEAAGVDFIFVGELQ